MRATRIVLVWVAVGAAGCGGGAGGGEAQSGCADCGPYGDILDAFCGVIDRCPGAVYPVAYRSRGECVAIMSWASTCRLDDDEVNDVHHYQLKRTIPTVSAAAASACVSWLQAASCQEATRLNDSGDAPVDGGIAASPCQGIFRIPDDSDSSSQPPVPPPAPAGERCSPGDQHGVLCRLHPPAGSGPELRGGLPVRHRPLLQGRPACGPGPSLRGTAG
jgi:hypothetical protein